MSRVSEQFLRILVENHGWCHQIWLTRWHPDGSSAVKLSQDMNGGSTQQILDHAAELARQKGLRLDGEWELVYPQTMVDSPLGQCTTWKLESRVAWIPEFAR